MPGVDRRRAVVLEARRHARRRGAPADAGEAANAGETANAGEAAGPRPSRRKAARDFAVGIGCLTAWFFLWLGLLGKWDLSKLFPFEGLNPAMMAVAAWLVLKEKLPASAWAGIVLLCAGIAVVTAS